MGSSEAWQSAPDAPGLWWRYAPGSDPVLCRVRVYPLQRPGPVLEALGVESYRHYSVELCDGVVWARCEPPARLS